MPRTFWLSILTLLCVAAGAAVRVDWPNRQSALRCGANQVRAVRSAGGPVVVCGEAVSAARPSAGGLLTLGAKLNLNRASADELMLVPGVGPVLAQALVRARDERGDFRTWDEVDSVKGIGPNKLQSLQRWTVLGETGAGRSFN